MRYGMLTVIEQHGRYWKVKCDCGNVKEFSRYNVVNYYRSCGCKKLPHLVKIKGHGMSDTPEYETWQCIKKRCFKKERRDYRYYGGRGITMHPPWVDDFSQFLKDVGRRPSHDMTIDRIDTNGNYEPGNIRWISIVEQQKNKRDQFNTVYYQYRGKKRKLSEISKITGIQKGRLKYFVVRRKIPLIEALKKIRSIDKKKEIRDD